MKLPPSDIDIIIIVYPKQKLFTRDFSSIAQTFSRDFSTKSSAFSNDFSIEVSTFSGDFC